MGKEGEQQEKYGYCPGKSNDKGHGDVHQDKIPVFASTNKDLHQERGGISEQISEHPERGNKVKPLAGEGSDA